MMTFLDFFAGVGGFRRGMELAGHKCVGFCEVDKYAVASYTSMHLITDEQREYLNTLDFKKRQKEILKEEYRNGEFYCDDVRRLRADDVPRADVWCFGFPCQDISVAGKQLGFAGSRSSLFFAVTRVIRDLEEKDRPSVLFIENVKNLLSVNRGFDFAKLLVELDEIGYDCSWSVLNSKHFGVPQNRERVFVIGHLRERSRREVFPVGGAASENSVSIKQIGKTCGANRENPNQYRVYDKDGIAPTLNKMDGGGREPHIAQPVVVGGIGEKNFGKQWRQGNRIYDGRSVGTALESNPVGNTGGYSNLYAIPFKEDGEPVFTLTGQDRHGVGIEIEQIDIVQTVKVRKYEVDKEKLIACLRNAKEKASLNNKMIAEEFDLPITKVEHWFRNDSSFAVPDAEIWSDLKQLLKIETDEFDESILTFDEKLNEYDKSNRCYKATGISPTLTSASANEKIAIEASDKKIAAIWSDKYKCYIAIRKLTPKECFRLQGWTDDYFEKAEFVNSNSQLYKQAGNGVTVNVIYEIAKKL